MTRRAPVQGQSRPVSDDPREAKIAGLIVLGLAATAVLMQAGLAARRGLAEARHSRKPHSGSLSAREYSGEVRTLHGAAALLATSVLTDSAIEHYRGTFENPGMYTPLLISALTMLAGAQGAVTGSGRPRLARKGAYATAIVVGAVGTGFHVYNIARRPGGVSWLNLFYAAPFGAPAALSLAGLIGLAAERVGATRSGEPPTLLGMPAGRGLSALIGAGLAGTVGEVGLYHFRGAFQNPFMWLPIVVPPVASALIIKVAFDPDRNSVHRFTRAWLSLTALLGLGGVGFHAFGVSRAMGGWRNWSQNVLNGPPLPAPPSFSALSIAGLAALSLVERASPAKASECKP